MFTIHSSSHSEKGNRIYREGQCARLERCPEQRPSASNVPGPLKGGLVPRCVLSVKYTLDSENNIKDTIYVINDFL